MSIYEFISECIDLADENGVIQGFPNHLALDEYGKDFLQGRASYVLLQVQSTSCMYPPLFSVVQLQKCQYGA